MEILSREIPLFKNIFCGDIDRETEKELVLPDYCPDITRLIRVDATPYIENCSALGTKCTVNGTYIFTILYESDYNSALSYAAFPVSFTENIDIKDAGEESKVNAKINIRRIGCKMINPRKFAVRAKSALTLSVKSVERKNVLDVTSLPENVFVKKDSIRWEEQSQPKTYEFNFKENYSLPEKAVPIDDVVMSDFSAEKPECTVTDDGIMLKTSVTSKLLYSGENESGRYIMSTKRFPVTMKIDDLSVNGNVTADAEINVSRSEISVDVDSYGENRIVDADFTLKVSVITKKQVSAEYATDAFAADISGIAETTQMSTLAECEKISRVFSAESRFSLEETRFTELCDHTAEINECRIKTDENGTYLIGTYTVSVLGSAENGYESKDFSASFEEKLTADLMSFDLCDIQCRVFETNALLASDGCIDVRIMCRALITTENRITFSAVTGIRKTEEKMIDGCTLIFCYPGENDTLWSISKRYFTSPEKVASDNSDAFDQNGAVVTRTPIRITK